MYKQPYYKPPIVSTQEYKSTPIDISSKILAGSYSDIITFLNTNFNNNLKDKNNNTPVHLIINTNTINEDQKVNLIKILISNKYLYIDTYNNNNETPLHCAIKNQYYKIINLLLDEGANPNKVNNYHQNALHLALIPNILSCEHDKEPKNLANIKAEYNYLYIYILKELKKNDNIKLFDRLVLHLSKLYSFYSYTKYKNYKIDKNFKVYDINTGSIMDIIKTTKINIRNYLLDKNNKTEQEYIKDFINKEIFASISQINNEFKKFIRPSLQPLNEELKLKIIDNIDINEYINNLRINVKNEILDKFNNLLNFLNKKHNVYKMNNQYSFIKLESFLNDVLFNNTTLRLTIKKLYLEYYRDYMTEQIVPGAIDGPYFNIGSYNVASIPDIAFLNNHVQAQNVFSPAQLNTINNNVSNIYQKLSSFQFDNNQIILLINALIDIIRILADKNTAYVKIYFILNMNYYHLIILSNVLDYINNFNNKLYTITSLKLYTDIIFLLYNQIDTIEFNTNRICYLYRYLTYFDDIYHNLGYNINVGILMIGENQYLSICNALRFRYLSENDYNFNIKFINYYNNNIYNIISLFNTYIYINNLGFNGSDFTDDNIYNTIEKYNNGQHLIDKFVIDNNTFQVANISMNINQNDIVALANNNNLIYLKFNYIKLDDTNLSIKLINKDNNIFFINEATMEHINKIIKYYDVDVTDLNTIKQFKIVSNIFDSEIDYLNLFKIKFITYLHNQIKDEPFDIISKLPELIHFDNNDKSNMLITILDNIFINTIEKALYIISTNIVKNNIFSDNEIIDYLYKSDDINDLYKNLNIVFSVPEISLNLKKSIKEILKDLEKDQNSLVDDKIINNNHIIYKDYLFYYPNDYLSLELNTKNVLYNNTKIIELLLDKNVSWINKFDIYGFTPIFYIIKSGNYKLLQIFIETYNIKIYYNITRDNISIIYYAYNILVETYNDIPDFDIINNIFLEKLINDDDIKNSIPKTYDKLYKNILYYIDNFIKYDDYDFDAFIINKIKFMFNYDMIVNNDIYKDETYDFKNNNIDEFISHIKEWVENINNKIIEGHNISDDSVETVYLTSINDIIHHILEYINKIHIDNKYLIKNSSPNNITFFILCLGMSSVSNLINSYYVNILLRLFDNDFLSNKIDETILKNLIKTYFKDNILDMVKCYYNFKKDLYDEYINEDNPIENFFNNILDYLVNNNVVIPNSELYNNIKLDINNYMITLISHTLEYNHILLDILERWLRNLYYKLETFKLLLSISS